MRLSPGEIEGIWLTAGEKWTFPLWTTLDSVPKSDTRGGESPRRCRRGVRCAAPRSSSATCSCLSCSALLQNLYRDVPVGVPATQLPAT